MRKGNSITNQQIQQSKWKKEEEDDENSFNKNHLSIKLTRYENREIKYQNG